MSKKKSVVLLVILISVLGYCVRYLFNIFIAKHLSLALYGDFSVALRLLTIVSSLALFGTNVNAKRFLPTYIADSDQQNINAYLAWNINLLIKSFSIVVLVGVLAFLLMYCLHIYDIKALNSYHLAIYMLWLAPLSALSLLFVSILFCTHSRTFASFLSSSGRYILMFAFFFIAIIFLDMSLGYIEITAMMGMIFFLLLLVDLFLLYNRKILDTRIFDYLINLKNIRTSKWMQTSKSFFLNRLVLLFNRSMDILLIEIILHNEEAVGLFSACFITGSVLFLIPRGVESFYASRISLLLNEKGNKQTAQSFFNTINTVIFSVVSVMLVLIISFRYTILETFGESYTQASTTLIILSIAFSLSSYSILTEKILTYGKLEKQLQKILIVEFILALVSIIILTYFYGINGAAIGTLISILFKFILMLRQVKLNFDFKTALII